MMSTLFTNNYTISFYDFIRTNELLMNFRKFMIKVSIDLFRNTIINSYVQLVIR